jgi:tetratricopeptide (TPR) repeat protein
MSSKLRGQEREYLIQTANDATLGAIATTIFVDGAPTETIRCPHPQEIAPDDILGLVKTTHNEKKQEIELLLLSYRRVLQDGHPLTMHQLAVVLYHRGFFFEAQELAAQSVRLNGDMHQAFNQLTLVELALGHPREALAAASTAAGLRPNFADYRNNLGEALLAAGDSTRAILQFEQAVQINLYYADAYFNLGLARLHQALHLSDPVSIIPKISDAFRKACLIYPDFSGQAFESAMASLKERDFARAFNTLLSIREARRETRRHDLAATYLHASLVPEQLTERSLQDRIDVLTGQVSRYPIYPDLQADLGQAHVEMARLSFSRAVQHFRKAVELNPSLSHNASAYDHAEEIMARIDALLGSLSQKG